MQLITYLVFNGKCKEAFQFYERILGGKIEAMMAHAGTPAEASVPAEFRDKIIHARLHTDEGILMGCDAPPDHYSPPSGFNVHIGLRDQKEAERIFNALVDGGKVVMPVQQTFWASRFGMLVDRFGIPWMINCE